MKNRHCIILSCIALVQNGNAYLYQHNKAGVANVWSCDSDGECQGVCSNRGNYYCRSDNKNTVIDWVAAWGKNGFCYSTMNYGSRKVICTDYGCGSGSYLIDLAFNWPSNQCQGCPGGYYCPDGIEPKPCSGSCPNANYDAIPCNRYENLKCVPKKGYYGVDALTCPKGNYCLGGNYDPPKPCPQGTFNSLTGQSACSNCMLCNNQLTVKTCNSTSDVVCASCPPNSVALSNGSSYLDCICKPNYFGRVTDPTTSTCQPCPPNKFCPRPNNTRVCPCNKTQ